MSDPKPPNELAGSSSAYLRSAAHQPVHWHEWGDAAFAIATQQDKPILLDIGAVWCHWCHVMDRESYENGEIARIINESYVPVKVDRDERPDIDARYQMAVSALTGQGGWPLTAFLTPQGKPFYGGTYFPPDDRFGRPGMKRVLESIAQNYKAHRADIFSSADQISEALHGVEKLSREGTGAGRELVDTIIASIRQMFDAQHGGFGNAPKFPHPSALDLLLDAYLETGQNWILSVVNTTLEHMGRGGVYDQIGGGFHRYSVDERWIVPHFEKMSYDNAGLLGNYLRAFQVTGNEFFREIALGILSFIETVLSSPEGGFFSSQDADVNLDDDGDYFTWTVDEVKAALDEREASVVAQFYHVETAGEMHHNPAKNVLFIDQPLEAIAARLALRPEEVAQILASAKKKMLAARMKRRAPYVDTILYSSWNGMMISVLLEAYKVLGLDSSRDLALRTLDLLMEHAYDPARGMGHALARPAKSEASPPTSSLDFRVSNFDLLDDQVFMVGALLDAYEVTGKREYYDRALQLMDTTVKRFMDTEHGGFFDTAKDSEARQGALTMQRKAFQDSPTPAANAQAVLVLDRLARLAGRADFGAAAQATLDLFAPKAHQYGLFAATYALALVNHLRPPVEIVVVGPHDDERTRQLLAAAHQAPRAGMHVLCFEPGTLTTRDLPAGLATTLPQLPYNGTPLALVCVGATCQRPVETPEALGAILRAELSTNLSPQH
ncbi:MAG: thioredoxin domain-containing protein [Terriglobia bacterium]